MHCTVFSRVSPTRRCSCRPQTGPCPFLCPQGLARVRATCAHGLTLSCLPGGGRIPWKHGTERDFPKGSSLLPPHPPMLSPGLFVLQHRSTRPTRDLRQMLPPSSLLGGACCRESQPPKGDPLPTAACLLASERARCARGERSGKEPGSTLPPRCYPSASGPQPQDLENGFPVNPQLWKWDLN